MEKSIRIFRPTSCLWVKTGRSHGHGFHSLFLIFRFTQDVETTSLSSGFLFTATITIFSISSLLKLYRSPDSWLATLVPLCSGERKFLATVCVIYCIKAFASTIFFSALAPAPALKLHSIFLQDNSPCHTSRSNTTFYVCVMQPPLLWGCFWFVCFFHKKRLYTRGILFCMKSPVSAK